jgi:hypothetical protein
MHKVFIRRSLSARTLSGCSLRSVSIGIGPVVEAPQTGLITDLTSNKRVYRVQTHNLTVKFVIRVRDDMVFLICCHHQVGKGMSDTIEKDKAVFALWGFGGLGKVL